MKIQWRVDPSPVGRYKSFQKRKWPTAWYSDVWKPMAFIRCEDSYEPSNVKLGDHAPLTVVLCHHRHPQAGNSWKLLRMKKRFENLAEAKIAVQDFLDAHPEFAPREEPR